MLRSLSEPPEEDSSRSSGLRGGFPIKINGQSLGSQECLQNVGLEGGSERGLGDMFGPRIRSRQSSVAPSDTSEEDSNWSRRGCSRGKTPIRTQKSEETKM